MEARRIIEEIRETISEFKSTIDIINNARKYQSYVMLGMYLTKAHNKLHNQKILNMINHINKINNELSELEKSLKSNRIEKPEFSNAQLRHPINFLEDLVLYYENMPTQFKTIETIVDCLQGDAYSWAMIFKKRWLSIEDFKKDFLAQFWPQAEQSELKYQIVSGIWDKEQESMTQHFTSLVKRAMWLQRNISEAELIFDIMCHFPEDIRESWAECKQTTIREATVFLKKIDETQLYIKEAEPQLDDITEDISDRYSFTTTTASLPSSETDEIKYALPSAINFRNVYTDCLKIHEQSLNICNGGKTTDGKCTKNQCKKLEREVVERLNSVNGVKELQENELFKLLAVTANDEVNKTIIIKALQRIKKKLARNEIAAVANSNGLGNPV